jgi:enterochelin esterase-like enzyme
MFLKITSRLKGCFKVGSENYTNRVIEAHTLYSSHLSEERTLKVYLPPNYNRAQRYPVLYCHDGLEFFTHGRIATLANQLIGEGKLSPLFIVGIAVQMKTRSEDYGLNGSRHESYVRFVAEECIPFVESTYSINSTVEGRFMAGISLGATATLSLHMRYPTLFQQLLLFSGAFYESVQQQVRATPHFPDLQAYMVVGQQETAVETPHGTYDFYRFNQSMRDLLRIRGVKLDYHEAAGTHIWGFWQRQIPDALTWLEKQGVE